jgi:hypothetical protein
MKAGGGGGGGEHTKRVKQQKYCTYACISMHIVCTKTYHFLIKKYFKSCKVAR